jgi:hypothetical protein
MASFAERLRDYLAELEDLRRRGASEDSLRDAFLRFLRGVFPGLGDPEPILLEKRIPALRVRGGFADALYGDLIFECKKRLDDVSRSEGQEELSRYLQNQQHPERYLGILTDGQMLEVYAFQGVELARVDQLGLTVDRADEARLWLDCYLFHEKHLTPSANDVALRFGERSPTFWHSLRILQGLWQRVGTFPATQTKFAEWQSLLAIVYGSPVGDEGLFLRHTYLALFARVLAFVALERRAPEDAEVSGIVTGETFQRMGFDNFVEDDFFTWASDAAATPITRGLIHAVATRLTAAYDLAAIREDLLKELYQELVDPETRHDLGEFYTPDWLAELTLRRAGFPPKRSRGTAASLLDPSCGSGTFLFTAVRLLREDGQKGRGLVDYCTDNLAGIDVHPLAVTIAKTNLLLALGSHVRGHSRRITLPVYMADTLSSATPSLQENIIPVPVDVDTIASRSRKRKTRGLPVAFELPEELAGKPELLHGALEALFQYADPGIADRDAADGFGARLAEIGVSNGKGHVWRTNLGLMRWLLASPATDSVWRFVLRNACQPELLARRKFGFVVGNPPWLSYRYIKRPDYQQRVRQLVFRYELLGKRQAHLVTQMELATLFFAFSADRYLAHGGTLAFVMPRSILTGAKQHAAFRDQYVTASRSLIDCEQVTPLFNVPACAVIASQASLDQPPARRKARKGISTLHLQGLLPSRNASLAQAERCWHASETTYKPLAGEAASPYWSEIVNGATIFPRCLWFVRPPETARVIDRRRPHVETDRTTERQGKAPWKGIRLSGAVEAEFLFATLLSDNMVPFGGRQLSLVVLPVAEDKRTGVHLLGPDAAIRRGRAGLADWLRKAEEEWKEHRKSDVDLLDYLNWQNKLTQQRPSGVVKLIYNGQGTHLCACVVDATDVGAWSVHDLPVRGFVAENVTYWWEAEVPEQAHFLCAVLNAPLVDRAIKPYQTKGAFGAQRGKGERHIHRRPFEVLPIPRYNRADANHRKLARLSMRCHEKVAEFLANADERQVMAPIGRLRNELRAEWLRAELAEIDGLVADILKNV